MSLHQVDKLVREGRYREAMKALHKARDLEPSNPYITAYEERLRGLLAGLEAKAGICGSELPLSAKIASVGNTTPDQDLPTVEQQMNAIAVPVGGDGVKRVAILGKVASLLRNANEYLNEGQYDRALEELWRANLLDPENREIDILDAKIRAAKAEAQQREEQERARQAVAENEERERRLQEERDRVQREQEEQQLKEEEAKKAAQVERVQQCIAHARSLFLSGMLDDAQQELSFAMVLDPQNVQAHLLHGEITRRAELIRRAEEERRRREEEERRRQEEERRRRQEELRRQEEELRRQEEELRARIADAIARATEARNRKDFNEALRIVTQTYLLDPSNDALQACENSIVAAHEEWMYQQEEERRKREAELRKQQDEERRQREEEERQTLLREKRAAEEARRRSVERETREHLSRAMELLNAEEFDEALAEVARAFAINPFKPEVKEVEELVLKAQEASRLLANLEQPARREESPLVDEPLDEPGDQFDTPIERKEGAAHAESVAAPAQGQGEAILSQIAAHVAAANFSTSQGDFARAFDEIAKAYALDAENPAIADCETSVQESFLRYLQALSAAAPAPQPPEQSQLDFSETVAAFNAPMGEPVPGTIPGDVVEQRRVVLLRKEMTRGIPWHSLSRKRIGMVVGGLAIVAALYAGVSGSSHRGPTESLRATAGPAADIVSPPTRQTEQSKFVLQASAPEEEKSRPPAAKGKSPAAKASERKGTAAGRPSSLTDALRPATTSYPEPMLTGTPGEKEDQPTGTPFGDELVPTRMETSSPSARMPNPPPSIKQQTPGQKVPEIVRLERPRIPAAAVEIRAEGEVVVRVEVSPEGRPLSASIVRSSSPIYNDAVVDAVMHSEYSPSVPPNGASSSWITIPFKFKQ